MTTFGSRLRRRLRARFIGLLEACGYALCAAIASAVLYSWFSWTDVKKPMADTIQPKTQEIKADTALAVANVKVDDHSLVRGGQTVLDATDSPAAILLAKLRLAADEADAAMRNVENNNSEELHLLRTIRATLEGWERDTAWFVR